MGITSLGTDKYPNDFHDGVVSNETATWALFRCNTATGADKCDFNALPPLDFTPEKVEADSCATCDSSANTCTPCSCGTGEDCVPAKDCADQCKAGAPRYACSWNTTVPTCVPDPSGK